MDQLFIMPTYIAYNFCYINMAYWRTEGKKSRQTGIIIEPFFMPTLRTPQSTPPPPRNFAWIFAEKLIVLKTFHTLLLQYFIRIIKHFQLQ